MLKKKWNELAGERTNEYFAKEDLVVLSDYARYDYKEDGWKYDPDSFFANVINSNDADKISEKEAKEIVEKNGGTHFDEQEELIAEQQY